MGNSYSLIIEKGHDSQCGEEAPILKNAINTCNIMCMRYNINAVLASTSLNPGLSTLNLNRHYSKL